MIETRQNELNHLERMYNMGHGTISVVYYPRQIGPVPLLNAFLENKDASFYLAREASDLQQRKLWGSELRARGSILPESPSYEQIFTALLNSGTKPLVLVIRGFDAFFHEKNDFMKSLIEAVRRSDKRKLVVLLMTDNVNWAENKMVEDMGEFATGISYLLRLKEPSFFELMWEYPSIPMEDMVRYYAVLGSGNQRWDLIRPQRSFKQNICEMLLKDDSPLQRQFRVALTSELRETAVYQTILYCLSTGKNKLNDLYLETGFSRPKLSVYLKNLIRLELVEKVYSFGTNGIENTMKGCYRIVDPLLDFWFFFVYPNLSMLQLMSEEQFYDMYISADVRGYVNPYYSRICRQWMLQAGKQGRLPIQIETFGEWPGKTGTIDIVARSDRGTTILGMCSWSSSLTAESYEWLVAASKKAHLKDEYLYFFSGTGFDDPLKKLALDQPGRIRLIGLQELSRSGASGLNSGIGRM